MTSKSEPVDAELLAAHDLAVSALREVTPAHTIGEPVGYIAEDGGVVSLRFANTLAGYPGWFWTVSLARVEDAAPTVLEVELMPGDGALLAPEWVPWAERLADYQAAQTALAEAAESAGEDEDDFDADDDELDDDELDDDELDDDDDEGQSRLHAGDVDGVDIDELDVTQAAGLDVDGEAFEDGDAFDDDGYEDEDEDGEPEGPLTDER